MHERVGRLLERARHLDEDEQLAGALDLGHERGVHRALDVVGLALERHHSMDRLEEGVHVLARPAALHLSPEHDGTQVGARGVEHQRGHRRAAADAAGGRPWASRPR